MMADSVIERRLKPRISVSFPATLRGIDASGKKFEVQGVLGNISASGMYVCTQRVFEIGDQVFATVRLSGARTEEDARNRCLAVLGNVVRVEVAASQTFGAAIKFNSYKFV